VGRGVEQCSSFYRGDFVAGGKSNTPLNPLSRGDFVHLAVFPPLERG